MLKTTQDKKKKHIIIDNLGRSKLNSIESKISETLINNEINHEDFTIIFSQEKNCQELKESIKQRIGIDKTINRNEVINNDL